MANIKWENIRVGVSALGNKIYLGKVGKDNVFTDRSEDRSEECTKAVMQCMHGMIKDGESSISCTIEGFGKLTFTKD